MVSTRSHDNDAASPTAGEKRPPSLAPSSPSKKRKTTEGDEASTSTTTPKKGTDDAQADSKSSRKSRSPKKEKQENEGEAQDSEVKEEKKASPNKGGRKPHGTDGENARPGEVLPGKEKIGEEEAERKHGSFPFLPSFLLCSLHGTFCARR
jgi:hypothetical protein